MMLQPIYYDHDLHWIGICISSAIDGADYLVDFLQPGPARRYVGNNRNSQLIRRSDPVPKHQAMISAIIVITLLSLLVATDPEAARSATPPSPQPPLRPDRKPRGEKSPESGRLAA